MENNGWNEQQQNSFSQDVDMGTQSQQEVPEVKMSKKSVGAILVLTLLFCIIIVVCFRSCSVRKEVKSNPNIQGTQIVENEGTEHSTNTGEELPKISENTIVNGDPNGYSSKDVTEPKNEIKQEVVENFITEEEVVDSKNTVSGLTKVSEPELGESNESTAMVSAKQVYVLDNSSYAYSVNLVLLKGTDDTENITYLCPKKTYDAINVGDSLKVVFQMDAKGVISISSVSR